MFGIWPRRKIELLDYWYVLLPDFQISTPEFYEAVEQELIIRKVPGMELSHVLFPEGGVLSARREYLRMRRERLLFDVCSSSFGTSWFFSCRFAEIPVVLRVWQALVILGFLFGIWCLYAVVFGFFWGSIICGTSVVAAFYFLGSVLPMGLFDLDARLIKIPVLGAFYEAFFRRDTYFREDSRLMYCDLVNQVVREKVKEFAGTQEVTKVEFKKDPEVTKSDLGDLLRQTLKGFSGSSRKR